MKVKLSLQGFFSLVCLLGFSASTVFAQGACIEDATPYNGNSCDDGKLITLNDTCSNGVCSGDTSAAAIPTLSEWGMIIFMTIIVGISVVVLSRRRMV